MAAIVEHHRLHGVGIGGRPGQARLAWIAGAGEVGPGGRHFFRQGLCLRRVAGALFAALGIVETEGEFGRVPGTRHAVEHGSAPSDAFIFGDECDGFFGVYSSA